MGGSLKWEIIGTAGGLMSVKARALSAMVDVAPIMDSLMRWVQVMAAICGLFLVILSIYKLRLEIDKLVDERVQRIRERLEKEMREKHDNDRGTEAKD
jgi:predicted ATP-grasp superfamily ATP-dependent carboligase